MKTVHPCWIPRAVIYSSLWETGLVWALGLVPLSTALSATTRRASPGPSRMEPATQKLQSRLTCLGDEASSRTICANFPLKSTKEGGVDRTRKAKQHCALIRHIPKQQRNKISLDAKLDPLIHNKLYPKQGLLPAYRLVGVLTGGYRPPCSGSGF